MPVDDGRSEAIARKRRILAGTFASAGNVVVFILYQLVSLPVFLASYGDRRYSDWLILYSLPALLSVSDLGIPDVVGSQMTMLRSANEVATAQALYRRMRQLGREWLTGLIGVLLAAVWLINPVSALHLRTVNPLSARLTLTFLAFWLLLNLYWGIYSAGYQASKQMHRNISAVGVTRTAEFIVIIALVAFGASLPLLASGLLAVRTLATVWISMDFRRRTPWRQGDPAATPSFRFRSLLSPAIASMAFPAGTALQNQGLLLIIGWRAGAAQVVIVNSIRTITNASYQMNTFLKAGVTPEISDRFGADDVRGARDIAEKVTALVTTANAALAVGIALFGAWFLHVWSGGRLSASMFAVALFGLASTTDCLWHSMSNVAQAKNVHQKIAAAYFFACLAALPLCYWLAPTHGLIGIALSLFSTSIVVNLVTVPTVCSLLQTSVSDYAASSAQYLISLLRRNPIKLVRAWRT